MRNMKVAILQKKKNYITCVTFLKYGVPMYTLNGLEIISSHFKDTKLTSNCIVTSSMLFQSDLALSSRPQGVENFDTNNSAVNTYKNLIKLLNFYDEIDLGNANVKMGLTQRQIKVSF